MCHCGVSVKNCSRWLCDLSPNTHAHSGVVGMSCQCDTPLLSCRHPTYIRALRSQVLIMRSGDLLAATCASNPSAVKCCLPRLPESHDIEQIVADALRPLPKKSCLPKRYGCARAAKLPKARSMATKNLKSPFHSPEAHRTTGNSADQMRKKLPDA